MESAPPRGGVVLNEETVNVLLTIAIVSPGGRCLPLTA
jgi:hypothetical protein